MNRIAKILGLATAACLTSTSLFGALIPGASTATTKVYEEGSEKLTVYTDVPGHGISMINGYASRAKSDIYEIWVRSAASNNEWVQCFANMTYNRGAEMPELTGFGTATAKHAYQRFTAGWTHTYANIEMSDNSPVEVEIRKIGTTTLDGSASIVKSAVHPAHKIVPGSKRDENGRVYFKIDKPCQMVIDINGQMDDHNAAYASNVAGGRMPDGSPVHSIAFYANPIMAKPVAGPTNTLLTVDASQSTPTTRLTQPDPATYDTLAFGPGVHNIGPNFKVHPGKSYFIPGDAIVYGNIGNGGVPQGTYRSNGDRIRIYGYGTICGIQVPHYQNNTNNPEYPEWNAWTGVKDQGVGIEMSGAWDTTITGVTTIDPANFNTKFDGQLNRTNDQSRVSWVKLHSWRVNGDGFGGYAPVEDSFFRTSDDSTYVRDWRRRCTFWKDTNANLFRFVNYKAGGLDDCDIIYARWRDSRGVGSVFEFANGGFDQAEVLDLNLTIRDIRFHDKHSNPSHLFSMNILQSYRGLVFENISAYVPKNGNKSTLFGSATAPWYERLVFKNVTYKASAQSQYETGTLLTAANFNTYFDTNEFVKYTLFDHPRDLTLAITADPVRGFVTKTPNQATHVETTLATLTATPEPGYIFTNWVGLDPEDPTTVSTANPITIRMLNHRNLTANFGLADIANPVVITTPRSGSWVVPEGVYSATIQAWGGGGAGGSAQHTLGASNVSIRGGGGTGGSFSSKTLRVSPGQVINYQVGAGGVGSTLPSGQAFPADSNSGDGSSSSASVNGQNTLLAIGGLGGKNKSGTTSSTGGGGRTSPLTGNIGDLFYYGGNGAGSTSNGTGGGGGSAGALGAGGNAPAAPAAGIAGLGGGAAGAAGHNGTIVGNAGGNPGGGGSGAGVRNSSAAYTLLTGGKGGDGKLVATYNTLNVDFNLTTQATPGGSVTPGGIYDAGTIVTLQATPLAGYRFTGWSGGLTGTTNPATFTLGDDTTVTANFVRQYSFTTSASNGTVTLSPPGGLYDAGTEVTITAAADLNYRFAGWAGDLAGSTNPLVVVIASDLSVAGNFIQQFTLTTSATNGSITLSPPGGTYDAGTPVTVTAAASQGYRFNGWSGTLSGTTNPSVIVMDSSKSVGAAFIQQFTLTTSATNGAIALSPPGGTYDVGTPVTVTADANPDYRFNGWSGALAGATNPSVIVMDGSKSITASFVQQFTLTTSAANGNITLSPPGGVYDVGTPVTVTAAANPNYRFDRWSGALSDATNPSVIVMDASKSVTASFIQQFTLTTNASDGSITLSPPGGTYDVGTPVTVTAAANPNYRFNGWSGALSGVTNPSVIVMDASKTITASFIQQFTLTTSAANGSITLSPPGGTYDAGTPVTVTAVANPDTQFVGWGGALSGTLNPQIITMDASKSVTADFNQQFSLVTQSVNGTISASVAGGTHNAGTPITLTATADENYRFTGWSGSLTGSSNPATIVMDANQVITANFIRVYQLTTAAVNGTVSPASGTFDEGSSVTLTASPALGFGFLEWSGDVAGPVNPVTVVMDGPKSVTASFRTKEAFGTPGSGTWVVPAGVYSLLVEAWGGGGGGGSAHHQPGATNVSVRGGGGAGGGYSRTTLQVRPGQEINYTVAAGGAGSELGAEPSFPTGSRSGSGATSSAILNGTPFLSAVGGQGGVNMSGSTVSVGGGAGVAASSGSIGDVTRYGGDGGTSSSTGTGGGGGSAGFSTNGGHASFFTGGLGGLGGGATGANGHNITAAGVAGNPPGAGGSGGGVRNNSSPNAIRIGGKGGDGLISITQNPLNVTFTLEMQTSVGGSVSPGPSVVTYPAGTTVNISAVAADGYRFSGWSGSFTGTSPSAAVLLEENMTIKANFIPRFTLTTSAVNGTLTLNPPGGVYDADTVVTASIQADANHRFTGWSGAASGTASQVEVTMDGNKDLTALIVRQYTLTTSATNGTITVNPPGGTYDENAVIRLTATPDSGYTFSGWSDGSLGSSSTVDITMSALRSVTANFTSKGERVPWTVNFDGLANTTSSQGLPASWTATRTGGGTFRVLTNRLAINGAGGEGVFTSGIMDISGGNVNLSISLLGSNNLENKTGSTQDYFRLYTRINGGAETLVRQVLGNQSTTTWTASNLSGNTLQIIVRAKVTDSTEYYYLDNVSVVDVPLPSPWQTADIGAVAAPGLARVKASTWTILGSGQDIWGTADEFRYVYQTTSADCNVVAQVASMTNTNGLAKSGVMIRESTAAGSINAMVCATPDEGVVFQWRSATGGSTSSVKITGLATPKWLKIERVGNSFTAFHSNDNTTWNPIGTAVTLPMAASATTGMAVTSRNDGVLCTSTVSGAAAAP